MSNFLPKFCLLKIYYSFVTLYITTGIKFGVKLQIIRCILLLSFKNNAFVYKNLIVAYNFQCEISYLMNFDSVHCLIYKGKILRLIFRNYF